jgi:hypothetical protein
MKGHEIKGLWLIVPLLMVTSTGVAQDRTCTGVAFPVHTQVNGRDLTLNGLGLRKATFLRIHVYVAALYVDRPSHNPADLIDSDAPQELILHFVRNVRVEDIREALVKGFEHGGRQRFETLKPRVEKLSSWMADMKAGQRLIFVRSPERGVHVSVEGADKGVIEGEDFSRAVVSIWLGNSPPNPELKRGLLGGDCR